MALKAREEQKTTLEQVNCVKMTSEEHNRKHTLYSEQTMALIAGRQTNQTVTNPDVKASEEQHHSEHDLWYGKQAIKKHE